MKTDYDFSRMKAIRNPYIKMLKQRVTIQIDRSTLGYFKAMADEVDIPYQNLINLYLRECAMKQKKLTMKWPEVKANLPRA